ncbi:hypothetical protein RHMOL_Rhmol11G0276700 [Rhododendron molle]|uniref:Uncharacterized protein n=1 Tax=Rhododendron molle TaxID=49168 RepID=A0ACC0LXE2_RHOML|nr:hypothetical protein RHMOL_Rhmol11G0276700 [Rhododendron molle]
MDNRFRNLEKRLWEATFFATLEATFFATLWSLWLVRNEFVFNNATVTVGEVVEKVKSRVAMWVKYDIKVCTVEEFKIVLDRNRLLKV